MMPVQPLLVGMMLLAVAAAAQEQPTATLIARHDDTAIQARLDGAGTSQLFSVQANAGEILRVRTSFLNNISLATTLTVTASGGETVFAHNETFSPDGVLGLQGTKSLVTFQAPESATYHVRVTQVQPQDPVDYLIFTRRENLLAGVETQDRLEASPFVFDRESQRFSRDEEDIYPFSLLAGQIFDATINLAGSAPVGVELLRVNEVVASATAVGNLRRLTVGVPETDDYRLRVFRNVTTSIGYTILVMPDNSALPSHTTPETAVDAGAGRLVQGLSLHPPQGAAWYRFEGLTTSHVRVGLLAARIESPLRARLDLRDGTGAPLALIGPTLGLDPVGAVAAPADGVLLVGVERIGEGGGVFTLELVEGVDAFEYNDTPQHAASLDFGLYDATFWPGQDTDYYALELDAGETLVVDVYASVFGGQRSMDPRLTVLGPNGEVLAENDRRVPNDPNDKDPRLVFVAPASGVYVIGARDVERVRQQALSRYQIAFRRPGDAYADGLADWRDLFYLSRQWQGSGPFETTGNHRAAVEDLRQVLEFRLRR